MLQSTASLCVSLLFLSAYSTCRAEDIVCASTHITVKGPFDENGNEPYRTTLQRVDADYNGPIVIRCQVTIPANVMDNFNPRLRFYLPRDSSLCIVPSGNDSHTNLENECGGFNYIYYEDKDATTINFTYYIIPIARMDLSVVNCGVEYAPPPTFCFGHLAALISFQDDPTCNPPSNTVNKTTSNIEPGTATEPQPPKTTPHSTTDNTTTASEADTPTNPTTAYNTTPTATGTLCGPAILKGPLNEHGDSEPMLRVEADLSSENPIVIRCQLNHTDPSVHYNLWLKINFMCTSLNENLHHWLTPSDQTFESTFSRWREGNITYYDVFINASARLEGSIIFCGADYQPTHGMPHQYCYTNSTAVIIFRDSTTAPPTTPIATPTNSANVSSTTTPTPSIGPTAPVIQILSSVTAIAILVGIILLITNFIQLGVIINRRANPRVQISATNDAALEQQDIEMDYDLELEEGTTIQNGLATDSG